MITLQTSRLILRQFMEKDAQFFFELNNDPDVIKFTGDEAFSNVEESKALIRGYDQYKKYKTGRLTVLLKETCELLGWCGLKYNPENGQTDLGFRFKQINWNKGYATEASRACLDYGFSILKLPVIVATAMKENTASIKVMEKLGMKFWKEVEEHSGLCVVYKMEKEDHKTIAWL